MATSFTHPPEWKDEERMYFLFSPFPPNTTVPASDPKVEFWSSLVMSSSKELGEPIFTEQVLKDRFKWKQSTPSCLFSVLQSMETCRLIVRMSEFNKPSPSTNSWLSWGVGIAAKPVSWAMKSYLPAKKYDGEYVLHSLVKVRIHSC